MWLNAMLIRRCAASAKNSRLFGPLETRRVATCVRTICARTIKSAPVVPMLPLIRSSIALITHTRYNTASPRVLTRVSRCCRRSLNRSVDQSPPRVSVIKARGECGATAAIPPFTMLRGVKKERREEGKESSD